MHKLTGVAFLDAIATEMGGQDFPQAVEASPEGVLANIIARTLATLPAEDLRWMKETVVWGRRDDLEAIVKEADMTARVSGGGL